MLVNYLYCQLPQAYLEKKNFPDLSPSSPMIEELRSLVILLFCFGVLFNNTSLSLGFRGWEEVEKPGKITVTANS